MTFMGEDAASIPLGVRWLVHLMPVAVIAGIYIQRLPVHEHLAVGGLCLLALVPVVAELFGVKLPELLSYGAVVVPPFVLATTWPVGSDISPFLLVLAAAVVGATSDGWRRWAGLAIPVVALIGVELSPDFDGAAIWIAGVVLSWFAGVGVRTQFQLVAQLHAASAQLAEQAAGAERERIAGELHDVVAHSLAVTMLHLTGARLALATDDRDEAMAALVEAERSGRASMNDIRRSVGVLRAGSGTDAPQPLAAELPALVEGFRGAGLPIDLDVSGPLADVSAASGLALYRIAQESLANVVKHAAGAAAAVRVGIADGVARLRVSNPVGPDVAAVDETAGWGVRGMRQRAEALGGTFVAAARDGEWVVEAEVPV
jgi:signal transduction histidine kinase